MKTITLTKDKVTLVDDEDYELLTGLGSWYAHKARQDYYARRDIYPSGIRYIIYMHRYLLEAKLGIEIPESCESDHINHNTLDNRRENLRLVTRSQQMINRRKYKNNKSGVVGVRFNTQMLKWSAQINIEGKLKYLGFFDKIEDAIASRRQAEKEVYGEFVPDEENH